VAEGDFDLALRGLLGEEAPLSAQVGGPASRSIGRRAEEAWQRRRLDDLEPVYLCADGVYVRAGLEMEKAVVLVVIVGCVNGGKVVVSVERSDRATAVIWKMLMVAERRFRRLNAPHLLAKVYAGVRYVDGVEATQEVAA
jgi:putative transposase